MVVRGLAFGDYEMPATEDLGHFSETELNPLAHHAQSSRRLTTVMQPRLNGSYVPLRLALAVHVAETVGGYLEKHSIGSRPDSVQPQGRVVWFSARDLFESRLNIIHFEEATLLRRVAAVFSQPDLNAVSSQNNRLCWRFAARHNPKAEALFVVGYSSVHVGNGQIHLIVGIRHYSS